MDQPQIYIASGPVFDDEEEARLAFVRGRLQWTPHQEAVTYRQKRDKIVGHFAVRVQAVSGLRSDGTPVYLCVDDCGTPIMIDHDMLMTPEQLLFKADGTPTVYHEWMIREMEEQKIRLMRMLRNPPDVTVLLVPGPPITREEMNPVLLELRDLNDSLRRWLAA